MEIKIFENQDALSTEVAKFILKIIKENPFAALVLTSGDTPKKAYQVLASMAHADDFKNVIIIGLDEWVGISPESEGSCKYIVEQNLLLPLGVSSTNYTFFDSLAEDLNRECKRVDQLIFDRGGLDFILLGIGLNGHLGLNEPGSSFESYCHITNLEEQTIVTGQKYFNAKTDLSKGITVGIKHLLEAKTAMIMANGSKKAEIISKTINSPITENLPATAIKKHKNGLIYIDQAAASLL
jgi:glucosamine-6-phosphate isomerase